MATPATSVSWLITFRKPTETSQVTYSITWSAQTSTEDQIKDVVAQLKKLGYVGVQYGLRVVLP